MVDVPLDAHVPASSFDAFEQLLALDGISEEIVWEARRGQIELAPPLQSLVPAAIALPLHIALPGGWSLSNPSIVSAQDSFRMIARASNVSTGLDGIQRITDANGVRRATHYLIDLGEDLSLRSINAIVDLDARPEPPAPSSAGLDDARLAFHRGDWWVTGSAPVGRAGEDRRIVVARLDGSYLLDAHTIGHRVPDAAAPWPPIQTANEDALHVLASIAPTTVVAWDAATEAGTVMSRPAPFAARYLYASSQAIPCGEGYLGLAYDEVEVEGSGTRTMHRWVWFDEDRTLALMSRPFVWLGPGCELATGLTARGEELVVSVAVDRREVWMAVVRRDAVIDLLEPPLELDEDVVARVLAEDPALATLREIAVIDGPGVEEPAPPLTIVSWTISGNSRDVIGDALRSVVDWVDWCVLVDTGITDDTIDVARSIAGDKLIVHPFSWRDDFSAARNFALARAADTGATWAVSVDTDERIVTNGVDIRRALAETTEPVLLAPHTAGVYTKDRFFRLPANGEYRGPTHEAFYRTDVFGGATVVLTGVAFDELENTNEQFRRKFERDREILSRHVLVDTDDPRWFYYWGDALQHLGRHEEAIRVFRTCADMPSKWDEESAWAMFRAAQSLMELGRKQEALEACAHGMTKHAGMGELSWYAAYISLQLGLPEQAVYWARQSIAVGYFAGIGSSIRRLGWKFPFGTWEGPFDVLRFALRDIGDQAGADEAERLYQEAAQARTGVPAAR
jgi:tetratricopeptide (TPR) repeat protein